MSPSCPSAQHLRRSPAVAALFRTNMAPKVCNRSMFDVASRKALVKYDIIYLRKSLMQHIAIMILRFCQRVVTYLEGCGCLASYAMAAVVNYLCFQRQEIFSKAISD